MRVMWVPKEVLGIIVKYCVEGNLGKLCRLRLVSPFWRDSIDNYIFYLDAKKVNELNVLFEKQKYRTVVYRDGFGNHAYRVKIADINSETLRYANYSYRRFYTGTLAILFNYSRRIKNIKKHVDDEKTYCYTAELKFIYSDSIKSRNTLQILWNDKPVTEQDYRQAITQNFLISITNKLIKFFLFSFFVFSKNKKRKIENDNNKKEMSVKFSVEFLKRGVCITYGTELQFMQYADIASVVHYTSFGVREFKINHKFYSRQNFYLRDIEHDVCLDLMSKFQSNMREFYSNTSSHQ